MLKVPRMLDEIDPLPFFGIRGQRRPRGCKQMVAQPPSVREIEENQRAGSDDAQWISIPGKPHFYTRNGKLKYEPPVPLDGVTKKTDVPSMAALEDSLVAALRVERVVCIKSIQEDNFPAYDASAISRMVGLMAQGPHA